MKQLLTIQIDQMIQPMTVMLKGNPNLPAAFVDEYVKRLKDKLLNGQVEEVTVQEYAKFYTRQEIQQMIAYQESPVGRKARQVTPQMLAEVGSKMQELGGRLGREVAVEIMQEHPEYMYKSEPGGAAGGVTGGVIGGVPGAAPPPPPPPKTGNFSGQRVDQQVQEAKLIRKIDPVYPPLAKAARVQGTVRFTAVIDKDGNVESLTLVSGHPLLVNAAKTAVLQWKYEPTIINGAPVEVITEITVTFHLDAP